MNPLFIMAMAGLFFGLIVWKMPKTRPFKVPAWGVVALFFVLSRLLLLLIALIFKGGMEGNFSPEALITALEGADTEHYLRIAEFGYQPGTDYQNLIVFYPLYPLLIYLVHFIIPNYAVSGILISNICAFFACILLYKLVKIDHGRRVGLRAVKYFLLFPFSFFLLSAYTEGLFLLLSIGCLYAARKRRYVLCAGLGALCAFTRNQGVLLIVPAVYEFIYQEMRPIEGGLREKLRRMPRQGFALPLIALGFVLYLGVNYSLYGKPLAFMEYQAAEPWFQTLEFFPINLRQHWNMGVEYPGLNTIIYLPQIALFFVGIWSLHQGNRLKMRLSWLIYGLAYIIISYSAGWLISGGRYMLGCVPMFMALALWGKRPSRDMGITLFFGIQMVFLFILFIRDYSIM